MRPYAIILCVLLFCKLTVTAQSIPTDINAELYINRAGIQSPTEKDAINKFVRALKYYDIWDNIHALYIPTGGTELSHKLNLKDPRDADDAYRLFYPNGAEHSNYGTDWNGIDQGALTFYSPTSTRLHLMIYQDEDANQPYIFSGDRNGITDYNSYTWSALYSNGSIGFANQGNLNYNEETERRGFFYGQRITNDSTEGYVDGMLREKWHQPFSAGYNTDTSQKIWINKTNGSSTFLGTAQYQVMSIGNIMDSSSVEKYYEIVQAFLSELGIQVGSATVWPLVPNNFTSDYSSRLRWVKATENAVDTARDGAHLYFLNDSLYLWGGWNGYWYPFDFNTGYVSGDGGHNWSRIGQAPWNIRHSAAYGTDQNGNGYLVGSDVMPTTTGTDRKEVWKTIDGRDWELKTNTAPWSENLVLHGLAIKGDSLYVGGGQFGPTVSSGLNDTIWRSTDGGVSWTAITTNAHQLGGILYNNFKYYPARNKFVAFCGGVYDNDPSLRIFAKEVWTSDDCINWTREDDVPFAARQYSNMIEWDGKLWVWAGDRPAQTGNGSLNLKGLWYMDSLGKWHEVGSIPVPERHATALAVDKKNDRLVFAVGNLHSDVWYLEKYPLHNDEFVYLDSNCSIIVPDCTDSLQNDFGSQVSFTQIPLAGTIMNASPGDSIAIKITADFGNNNLQTTNFYLIVKDTVKPAFVTPPDQIIYLGDSCSIIIPDVTSNLNVTDCSNVTVEQSPAAGTVFSLAGGQIFPITIIAEDSSGNINSSSVRLILEDSAAPSFVNPSPELILQNDQGICGTNTNLSIPIAQDNCPGVTVNGLRSDGLDLDQTYPPGTTTINWIAIDNAGNSKSFVQRVEVEDNELPILNFPDEVSLCPSNDRYYTLPELEASDNCGISDVSYSISGATSRAGNGTDASGDFNDGINTLTWTVTDVHGNSKTIQSIINISGPLIVEIPDVYILPRGVSANTLYNGYGATSIPLTAVISNGFPPYSYNWSTGELSSNINVNVNSGTQTYHVNVSDSKGCLGNAEKTIQVVNVRCGTDLDRVSICQLKDGQLTTLCVEPIDVLWYIERQSFLGICADNVTNINGTLPGIEINNRIQIAVMPNPSSSYFNIKVESFDNLPISVRVMNAIGSKVDELKNLSPGTVIQIGQNYLSGVYFLEARQGKERLTYKLVKANN